MTIATLADQGNSYRQRVSFTFQTMINWASGTFASSWGFLGGSGGSVGNTANGLVPVSGAGDFPYIAPVGSGAAYITNASFSVDGASGGIMVYLFDRLFHAGSYSFFGTNVTTLTSQPSFAARIPNSDYSGLRLFAEPVVSGGGAGCSIKIDYTNQAGTTGRSTGTISLSGTTVQGPDAYRLPLQSGDSGIQRIDAITTSGGATSTTNVFLARPLLIWRGEGPSTDSRRLDVLGMPRIYDTSALFLMAIKDGNSGQRPVISLELEVSSL